MQNGLQPDLVNEIRAGSAPSTPASNEPFRQQIRPKPRHLLGDKTGSVGIEASLEEGETLAAPNPLTKTDSKVAFLTDSAGRQKYLGHSSTWSFSWRVRTFLNAALGEDGIRVAPRSETASYSMTTIPFYKIDIANNQDKPDLAYAEFLTHTALFRLGSTFHVFDKEKFLLKLHHVYEHEIPYDPSTDIWHTQFLLVMAIGKLLLGRGASALGPPGANEFIQAMKQMPDISGIYHQDSVLGVEILCLASLYLFSADMSHVAYAYISQAQGICLSVGMNRELPPGILEESEREHRRRLWWSVFMLDRKLSVNMRSPLSGLRNEDMDLLLPDGRGSKHHSATALALHVKITLLSGDVIMAAYRIHRTLDAAFLRGIQDLFSAMDRIAEDFLTSGFDKALRGSRSISRAAATLSLSYHQCTILATRPILFTLMQKKMGTVGDTSVFKRALSEPVLAILKTCTKAAFISLQILSALHEQGLTEPFLPFDLEALFSSAFSILLVTIICPTIIVEDNCIAIAHNILGWMSSSGSIPAISRKRELDELQELADRVSVMYSMPPSSSLDIQAGAAQDEANLVWNPCCMDEGDGAGMNINLDLSSILQMDPGIAAFDSLLEDQWLWAGNDELYTGEL